MWRGTDHPESLFTYRYARARGGPWSWSECSFDMHVRNNENGWEDPDFSESDLRGLDAFVQDPAAAGSWNAAADELVARITGTNHVVLWGGIASIALGSLLATVWASTYAEPMFDVQAGPRHIRLSKSFGF